MFSFTLITSPYILSLDNSIQAADCKKNILEQQAKAAVEPKRNSISPKGIKEQSLTINSTDDDEIKGIFSNWYHLP